MHTGKPKLIILVPLICLSIAAISQVGIGTATPAVSAQLEINSTNRGLLLPRMTKAQRNGIASPADGLLVFQTGPDSTGFHYRFGGAWVWLQNATGAGSGWSTTGNSGMVFGTNYLGTRDNAPLIFGVNNRYAGGLGVRNNINLGRGAGFLAYPSTGANNIAIGDSALYSNNTGRANIAIGTQALKSNLGAINNIAIGDSALLANTTGSNNIAIGKSVLPKATTARSNIAIGLAVLENNEANSNNIAIGDSAMWSAGFPTVTDPDITTTSSSNIAIGHKSLLGSRSSGRNVSIGHHSMVLGAEASSNVSIGDSSMYNNFRGGANVSIGAGSMRHNGWGFENVSIGYRALYRGGMNLVTSYENVAIGSHAGYHNQGNRNVFIGYRAGYLANSSNKLYIDNNGRDSLNALVYGDFSSRIIRVNGQLQLNGSGANSGIRFNYTNPNSGSIGVGIMNPGSLDIIGEGEIFKQIRLYGTVIIQGGVFPSQIEEGALGDVANRWRTVGTRDLFASSRILSMASGNNTGIEMGYNIIGKQEDAGKIQYGGFGGPLHVLNVVGGGTNNSDRVIKVWAEGSTNFNGKVRIDGFTQMGTTGDAAPSIKMKKLTGIGPAVNGSIAINHGLTAAKILQVSVLMEYGLGAAETIPAKYTSSSGFEYEWQVRPNDIFIINRNGNSANIGNRPVRILITYEE